MANQDLAQLTQKQQEYVEQQVDSIRPREFFPRCVSDFETDGGRFILFIEGTHLVRFPSAVRVRLTSFLPVADEVYDVAEQEFSVGWTDRISSISVMTNASSDVGSVLVVTVESGLRQFYAVRPEALGKFALIRLEDETGRLVLDQQIFGKKYSCYTLGPRDLEYYRFQEWEWLFKEGKTVQLLAGLAYLNGTHMPSGQPDESQDIAEDVRAWLISEGISEKLMVHSNVWVREYASLLRETKRAGQGASGCTERVGQRAD